MESKTKNSRYRELGVSMSRVVRVVRYVGVVMRCPVDRRIFDNYYLVLVPLTQRLKCNGHSAMSVQFVIYGRWKQYMVETVLSRISVRS